MSKRNMRKKLAREYELSPRESRLLLRRCGYDYKLAINLITLYGLFDPNGDKLKEITKAVENSLNMLYDAFGAIGEAMARACSDLCEAILELGGKLFNEN